MGRYDHDGLNTFGTIYLAVSIIGAIALFISAVIEFDEAQKGFSSVADAHRIAGGIYLLYAVPVVLSGLFAKAVTSWMTATYETQFLISERIARLEAALIGPARAQCPAANPIDNRATHSVRVTDSDAGDRPTATAEYNDTGELRCSNCHTILNATGITWHICPNCQARIINSSKYP